jgi:hypothetical protein
MAHRVSTLLRMSKKAPAHHVKQVQKAAASNRRTSKEAAALAAKLMHDPRKSVREVAASALSQRAK